jgi:hypothetical protein
MENTGLTSLNVWGCRAEDTSRVFLCNIGTNRTTWYHDAEDYNMNLHHPENPKPARSFAVFNIARNWAVSQSSHHIPLKLISVLPSQK